MSEVEKMNEAMYERLGEIVFKAANTRTICNGVSGADEKNLQLLAAFTDLRQMCEFYKPGEHQNANLRQSDESTRMPQEPIREDSPDSPDSRSEAKKLEASVARQRVVLTQIADLALAAEAKSGNANVKLGSKFTDNSKAICAIRQLCGPDLVEKAQIESGAFYTPGWLCELAKKLQGEKSQSEIQREEARQKRKIHWTAYPTKVDLCVMGKTEQNGKVYEVRIDKRGDSKVQDTYGQCKVNGKTVITCSFTGNAWMLKRILTAGMQALVNYKAKKNRDSRRNYAKRKAASGEQQAHDNKGENGGQA